MSSLPKRCMDFCIHGLWKYSFKVKLFNYRRHTPTCAQVVLLKQLFSGRVWGRLLIYTFGVSNSLMTGPSKLLRTISTTPVKTSLFIGSGCSTSVTGISPESSTIVIVSDKPSATDFCLLSWKNGPS